MAATLKQDRAPVTPQEFNDLRIIFEALKTEWEWFEGLDDLVRDEAQVADWMQAESERYRSFAELARTVIERFIDRVDDIARQNLILLSEGGEYVMAVGVLSATLQHLKISINAQDYEDFQRLFEFAVRERHRLAGMAPLVTSAVGAGSRLMLTRPSSGSRRCSSCGSLIGHCQADVFHAAKVTTG